MYLFIYLEKTHNIDLTKNTRSCSGAYTTSEIAEGIKGAKLQQKYRREEGQS